MENETQANTNAAAKLWTASFLKIIGANTMSCICSSMIMQALPLYVMFLGSSKAIAGLVMGFYTMVSLVCRPFFGNLTDSKGRRFVLLIGITIISITCFSFSLASLVLLIMAIGGILGAGYSAFTTAAGTMVADILPRNRLNEGIGYYGVSWNIAAAFGPALMLLMRDHLGYQSIFYAAGIMSFLALLIVMTIKHEKKKPPTPQGSEKKLKRLTVDSIIEKTTIPSAFVLILITSPFGLLNTFLVKYSETLSITGIGLYFTFNAVAMILSRLFAGRICDRVGAQRALPPGLVLVFCGLLLIAFGRSLFIFLIAGSMLGFGYGIVFPTIQAHVMRSAPPNRRGAASATYYSAQDLGIGAGSIIGGFMVQAIGFSASFFVYSLFIAGGFAVFNKVLRKSITSNE